MAKSKKRKSMRSTKARKPVRNAKKATIKRAVIPRRQEKVSRILRNLGLSIILFVASLALYYASSGEFMRDLFWFSALITGLVSVSLILAYLVFFFLRAFGK